MTCNKDLLHAGLSTKFFKQQCFLLTHLGENPLAAFRMSQSSNLALLNKERWGGPQGA